MGEKKRGPEKKHSTGQLFHMEKIVQERGFIPCLETTTTNTTITTRTKKICRTKIVI